MTVLETTENMPFMEILNSIDLKIPDLSMPKRMF